MIFSSLKAGVARAWSNKRMVFVYFLANLLAGVIPMLPVRSLLVDFAGNSLMGGKLAGRLDMDFLFEFLTKNSDGISMMTSLMIFVGAIYCVFNLLLSGGAFSVFASDGRYNSELFWSSTARYFGRFFRLTLWSLPVLVALYCSQFLETAVVRLVFGKDPYQYITYWGSWVKIGLGYIGILLYFAVLDYSRIYVVLTDEIKMRRALWRGIKFTFQNFTKTFGLALVLFLIGGLVLLVYNPVADALHAPSAVVIIILLLVQQLYMFFRMTMRLTSYSSQLHLYRALSTTELSTVPASLQEIGILTAAPPSLGPI